MRSYWKNTKLFGLKLKTYSELNALPVYDDWWIITKIKTYGDKVYTNFHDFHAP